jgi:RNA polymerase sigma-70 factor, ECF subfamily
MDAPVTLELDQIHTEAGAAWPGVALDKTTFAGYLLSRRPPEGEDLRTLHLGDLYLACACLEEVAGALDAFERRYLAALGPALRSIDASPVFVDEVTQLLREKLFVGGKLGSYSGRGSLESWVAVAAHRIGLSLKRRQRQHAGLSDEEVAASRLVPEDPELAYLRARYRQEFQAALTAALAALSERQQVILRLTLVKGVSHARIASIYDVNQSTVTRWVNAARHQIWEELRFQLSNRLRMASGEVDSLIRFMKSDVQISISGALKGSVSE